jgi:multidrug efflux pump subunit AcrA (membrane-fusion protein)
MARKSQRKHQGLDPVGVHYRTQQASNTGNDRIEKAKPMQKLVAPVPSFTFTATYTSELEISDSEDMPGIIAETTIQTTAQDRKCLNHENQIQYSYAAVARPWDQQSEIQRGQYSSQGQTPFTVWENQDPFEEPFNDIGEVAVAFDSAGRQ